MPVFEKSGTRIQARPAIVQDKTAANTGENGFVSMVVSWHIYAPGKQPF